MTQESVLTRLRKSGLVVVARRLEQQHVAAVAADLARVGAPALEITLDDPTAIASIAELHRQWNDRMLVGAGTALHLNEAQKAISAGADFVVSPVFVPSIHRLCKQSGVLYIPGAATPTDIFRILRSGIQAVKVFPASLVTPDYVRDVLEPFRAYDPVLMLTGGLAIDRVAAYLKAGISIFGIGKSILDPAALIAQEYSRIGDRAQKVLDLIHETKQ